MAEKLCHICRFFSPFYNDEITGYCRRYAPHPVTNFAENPKAGGYAVAYWPIVRGKDGCGEWSLPGTDPRPD